MRGPAMDVTTETVGTIRIVRMAGKLDNNTVEAFDARMRELLAAGDTRLVLDFAHVTYVSSVGLRSLLLVAKHVQAARGFLTLAAVGPRVQEVFDIAGFTSIFAIAPTTEDALASMQADQ